MTRRWPVRRPSLLYAPLFVSLAIAWAVPTSVPCWTSPPHRQYAEAVMLGFTPVFLGNLTFANQFKDVGSSN